MKGNSIGGGVFLIVLIGLAAVAVLVAPNFIGGTIQPDWCSQAGLYSVTCPLDRLYSTDNINMRYGFVDFSDPTRPLLPLGDFNKCELCAWQCEQVTRPDGSWYPGNCQENCAIGDLSSDYVCKNNLGGAPFRDWTYYQTISAGGILGYKGVKVMALAESIPPPDPCEGVSCEPILLECPDGETISCSTFCFEGECVACTPDCTGHEGGDDGGDGITGGAASNTELLSIAIIFIAVALAMLFIVSRRR